ncbi:MAG: bifunctional phosphopantothenoylcysteine decarboxylase/phosphopantothenate--cysteine ligase CoaBC [Rikenellaceae bacterium]
MLENKNILLGITGGIAAYKAAILVRALKKEGCNVKVVMSSAAKQFITPLTMATLSGNPVLVDFFNPENGEWNSHVSLGLWADAYIIAPATASTIGKMVAGVADNLLVTSYLSARGAVFVAPAMDLDMYAHPTTTRNLASLRNDGVHIIEPESGFLASGLEGKGRMAEPDHIVEVMKNFFAASSCSLPLAGKRALVTAGGTIEPIDAVRFISNYSSGKMGYALAEALKAKGAEVTIIRAGVDARLKRSIVGVEEIEAISADSMYDEVLQAMSMFDIIIMAAAVADFAPEHVALNKMKKDDFNGELSIKLRQTRDIAAAIGEIKRDDQVFVGFALETDNERENAVKKLKKKNLDYIVLNSLKDSGAGFSVDTNKVTVIDKHAVSVDIDLKSKREVAIDIVDIIIPKQNHLN